MSGVNPSRRRVVLLAVLGVLVLAGVGYGVYLALAPAPLTVPSVALESADPEVAEAVTKARAAVLKEPKSAAAWGELAMTLHANAFLPDAAVAYDAAARLEPNNPDWPYLRGLALLDGPQPEAALPSLRKAVELDPRKPHLRARLGEALLEMDRPDEAEKEFDKLLSADASDARARFGLGQVAAARNDHQAALRHLEAVRDHPHARQRSAAQRAAIYGLLRDEAAAARERRRLAELPRDFPWPDETLARAQQRQVGLDARLQQAKDLKAKGRAAAARSLLELTVERYPRSDVAWSDLGVVLNDLGHHAAAERALDRSVELAPHKAENWLTLAGFLMGRQRYHDAERAFRKALELMPGNVMGHLGLGDSLRAQGDDAGAADAYREALRHRPQMDAAAKRLADLTRKP